MATTGNFITNEVATLIEHVELNRAGWWEDTIQRLVLSVVWERGEPLGFAEIQGALRDAYKRDVLESKLVSIIDQLVGDEMLLRLPGDCYQLPLKKKKKFEEQVKASEKIETDAIELFDELLSALSVDVDIDLCWECFKDKFLTPLIKQVGANAYDFLVGKSIDPDKALLDNFVASFDLEVHEGLRSLAVTFLDPKQPAVCAYIGRLLHAWFCVEASGLPKELLDKLNTGEKDRPHFRMFVDTNFLFSLLDLHDNPANQAAEELRELVQILDGNPKVELVVTPETIEEAKGSIGNTISRLKGVTTTPNIVNAAADLGLSGMAIRFLRQRYCAGGTSSPNEWFEPYLDNFIHTARSKGVELFNHKLDDYHLRQDVIDDIKDIDDHQKTKPEERRKSYRTIAHDMVLWHFVKDKRSAYVESPIDAREWVLTVDFSLIGFDKYKHRSNGSTVPICIHPSSFVQLLQFWVPRTKEFEEAMLGSLPVLFQEFDVKAEATSLRILSGIGRYEESADLSEETIKKVVVDKALRSRLEDPREGDDDEVNLVRDALIEAVNQKAESEARKVAELGQALVGRDEKIVLLKGENDQLEKAAAEKSVLIEKTASQLSSQDILIESLTSRVEGMEEERTVGRRTLAQSLYCFLLVVIVGASCGIGWIFPLWVPSIAKWGGHWPAATLISLIFYFVSHGLLEFGVRKEKCLAEYVVYKLARRFRRWSWTVGILGVASALYINQMQKRIDENGKRSETINLSSTNLSVQVPEKKEVP